MKKFRIVYSTDGGKTKKFALCDTLKEMGAVIKQMKSGCWREEYTIIDMKKIEIQKPQPYETHNR